MADSNELLGFVDCGEFHDWLLKCEPCMKNYVLWGYLLVGLGWVAHHNIGRGNPLSLLLTVRFAINSFDLR